MVTVCCYCVLLTRIDYYSVVVVLLGVRAISLRLVLHIHNHLKDKKNNNQMHAVR